MIFELLEIPSLNFQVSFKGFFGEGWEEKLHRENFLSTCESAAFHGLITVHTILVCFILIPAKHLIGAVICES